MTTRRQGGRQPGAWRAEAARLRRLGGWGPRRIAHRLGVSHTAVERYLKTLGAEPKLPEIGSSSRGTEKGPRRVGRLEDPAEAWLRKNDPEYGDRDWETPSTDALARIEDSIPDDQ